MSSLLLLGLATIGALATITTCIVVTLHYAVNESELRKSRVSETPDEDPRKECNSSDGFGTTVIEQANEDYNE